MWLESHLTLVGPPVQVLVYLRQCLAYEAGVAQPSMASLSAMQEHAPALATYIQRQLVTQGTTKGPLTVYIGIVRQLLTALTSQY